VQRGALCALRVLCGFIPTSIRVNSCSFVVKSLFLASGG
jgi:hypothetical protein